MADSWRGAVETPSNGTRVGTWPGAAPRQTGTALVRALAVRRAYQVGGTLVEAIRSATCSIYPGDRIAIIGPSGSGKSTLLQLLAGLDQPNSGSLTWPALGTRDQLRPRHIAMVFQAATLLEPLTVVENVELPLLIARIDAAAARRDASAALAAIDLASLAEKLPEELSGGQAQRVAVARAIAIRPKLILADEPTGQLDRSTAQRLIDVLLNTLEGSDTALIVATHDPSVAQRMRTIWTMQHGTLVTAS